MAQQELPEIPQFEYSEEEQESILADLDILVRDPIIPIFNLFRVIETTTNSGERGFDPLYIYRSRLVKAVVPQVPNYPEIVHWCAQNYLPEQRFIMSKDATRVIIKITPEAISAMLTFPQEPATREWDEDKLKSLYRGQSKESKEQLLLDNLKEKRLIEGPPYPVEVFSTAAIIAFCMVSQALGLDSAMSVTEVHLGALIFLSQTQENGQAERTDFCKYLSDQMHQGLQDFQSTRAFKFQSYLIHLFLLQQFSFMGHLHFDILRSDHTLKPVIEWCPKLRFSVQNENLFWYINSFLPILYTLLHDITPPRVIPEMVQELQPTP